MTAPIVLAVALDRSPAAWVLVANHATLAAGVADHFALDDVTAAIRRGVLTARERNTDLGLLLEHSDALPAAAGTWIASWLREGQPRAAVVPVPRGAWVGLAMVELARVELDRAAQRLGDDARALTSAHGVALCAARYGRPGAVAHAALRPGDDGALTRGAA